MFVHCPPIELKTYEKVVVDGRRHYDTPNGLYPSITTVLSSQDKTWLNEWKSKVGEQEAHRITMTSAGRGTNMHQMCEDYLNNIPLSVRMPDALELFQSIKPILHRINNIHFQEACLYSDMLKVAGSVDCIAEFDGVLSIIDFKNSRRKKTEDKIFNYYLQETFYSLAYQELSGIAAPQIVTIIAVEDDTPQVFIQQRGLFIKPLVELRKKFS